MYTALPKKKTELPKGLVSKLQLQAQLKWPAWHSLYPSETNLVKVRIADILPHFPPLAVEDYQCEL